MTVYIGAGKLFYAVLDDKKKYILLNTYSYTPERELSLLKDFIGMQPLFHLPFKAVKTAIYSKQSTLMPSALLDEKQAEQHLSLNHRIQADQEVLTDDIPSVKAKNIYAIPKALGTLLRNPFPEITLLHAGTPLIETLLIENADTEGTKVFVQVHKNSFEIVVIDRGMLSLYNAFNYETPEDFVYFILFACEQLQLHPERIQLHILGAMEKDSPLYRLAYKYIRNVSFGQRPRFFNYSSKLDFLPAHFNYNLFCINTCG